MRILDAQHLLLFFLLDFLSIAKLSYVFWKRVFTCESSYKRLSESSLVTDKQTWDFIHPFRNDTCIITEQTPFPITSWLPWPSSTKFALLLFRCCTILRVYIYTEWVSRLTTYTCASDMRCASVAVLFSKLFLVCLRFLAIKTIPAYGTSNRE